MGAPYIARAPKKVLVRIPRNEGYTTVPSGMATLRLIPSPLDKPATQDSTEGPGVDHQGPPRVVGASPLDRPQQLTTGVVPPASYTRNIHTETAQALNSQHSSSSAPASGVNSGALGPLQQLGHRGAGALVSNNSSEADSSRSSASLQGPRGARSASVVYQQEQRSSSPGAGHGGGPGGHLAAALAAAAATAGAGPPHIAASRSTAATAPAGGLLHYQGHFTAISGHRSGHCQETTTTPTSGRSQPPGPPPPFTDFIAGQVWRALMMASQQQQLQQGGVGRGGPRGGSGPGGKRTRDVAGGPTTVASMEAGADEGEPSRKMSRTVTQTHGPLQDPSSLYSPSGPGSTAQHTTTFHNTSLPPTPPSTPPTTQQQTYSSSSSRLAVDGPAAVQLAVSSCPPKRGGLAAGAQQPLVPLSPPALHLPIMFPPVFPQSMTSMKGGPAQQFSLRSSSSSGPVAVSGSGGGGLGEAPPHHHHHHHHHQASQLTVGPLLSPVPPPTNPLLLPAPHHRLSHHHPPTAALLQPTHGPGQPAAAHVEAAPPAVPCLTAAAAPTPMAMMLPGMAERSGQEHQGPGTTTSTGVLAPAAGLCRGPGGPVTAYSSRNNDKTSSSSRSTYVPTQQQQQQQQAAGAALTCHPTVLGAAVAAAAANPIVVVNSDTNTSITSHCST